MKKFIVTSLLIVTCLFAGKAQATSTDSPQNKDKNHRGHNYQGKGGRHHKGINLFHRHHPHGKDNARSNGHSHHGKKGQGERKSTENK